MVIHIDISNPFRIISESPTLHLKKDHVAVRSPFPGDSRQNETKDLRVEGSFRPAWKKEDKATVPSLPPSSPPWPYRTTLHTFLSFSRLKRSTESTVLPGILQHLDKLAWETNGQKWQNPPIMAVVPVILLGWPSRYSPLDKLRLHNPSTPPWSTFFGSASGSNCSPSMEHPWQVWTVLTMQLGFKIIEVFSC